MNNTHPLEQTYKSRNFDINGFYGVITNSNVWICKNKVQ